MFTAAGSLSRGSCLRLADGERRCAEQADHEHAAGTRAGRPRSRGCREIVRAEQEWRNSTSAPSRTPRPLNEIGSTWSIETAGTNASTAGERDRQVERAEDQRDGQRRPRAGRGSRCRARERAAAGSRRRRSTPMCTAPMNRIQFSCSANRPAMRGWPATNRMTHEHGERDAGDEQRDPRVVDVEQRRPDAKPTKHEQRERDEAGQPLEHDRRRTRSSTSRSCSTRAADAQRRRRRSSTAARCRRTARRSSGRVSVAQRDACVEDAAAPAASARPTARCRRSAVSTRRGEQRERSAEWCRSGMRRRGRAPWTTSTREEQRRSRRCAARASTPVPTGGTTGGRLRHRGQA